MAHSEKTTSDVSSPTELAPGPLLISVDDVGQFLAVVSARLVMGHSSDGQADLPFLANVGARHAELERRDSLREGTVWSVRPLGRERISVNGSPVVGSQTLVSGDQLRLSENLAVVFRSPDPASQSALLELQGAEECLGAQRVILWAAGAGGRLRVGAGAHRLIRVPNLKQQLQLEWGQAELRISCSEASLSSAGVTGKSELRLGLPLAERQQIAMGQPVGGRPAFSLGIGMASAKGLPRGEGAS